MSEGPLGPLKVVFADGEIVIPAVPENCLVRVYLGVAFKKLRKLHEFVG
ncbi:MAG: hypothetical protein QXQ31_07335 [Zestosphaera sp.]